MKLLVVISVRSCVVLNKLRANFPSDCRQSFVQALPIRDAITLALYCNKNGVSYSSYTGRAK